MHKRIRTIIDSNSRNFNSNRQNCVDSTSLESLSRSQDIRQQLSYIEPHFESTSVRVLTLFLNPILVSILDFNLLVIALLLTDLANKPGVCAEIVVPPFICGVTDDRKTEKKS
jgi:hypothetical protein